VLVFTDLIRLRRARGEDVDELLAEARALYPENKLLWWIEAAAMISEDRHADALAQLDRLLAVDVAALPGEGPAYDARIFGEFAQEARGACLFRLGRYAESAEAYAQALHENPDNLVYRSKWMVARGRAARETPQRTTELT
jgi:tetratricopeptide (TPR) repeat protein